MRSLYASALNLQFALPVASGNRFLGDPHAKLNHLSIISTGAAFSGMPLKIRIYTGFSGDAQRTILWHPHPPSNWVSRTSAHGGGRVRVRNGRDRHP